MKKETKQNIASVALTFAVHIGLCIIYNFTYYSTDYDFSSRFTGFSYWFMLISAFLAAPFTYFLFGRFRTGKGDKKSFRIIIWTCFSVLALIGVVGVFVPTINDLFRIINAPCYMYYNLFEDSVIYLKLPAVLVSAFFPAFFTQMGYLKKPRTNNEITMDEVEKIKAEKEKDKKSEKDS